MSKRNYSFSKIGSILSMALGGLRGQLQRVGYNVVYSRQHGE